MFSLDMFGLVNMSDILYPRNSKGLLTNEDGIFRIKLLMCTNYGLLV